MCMSIVASAFQYGWAPTLMPDTTMLISPPAWVKLTIRRSAAATQSMFSVPESIAIRAPEETANHSTGTSSRSARSSAAITRVHSGSASEPSPRVGSPSSATRSIPSGWRSVRLRISADDDARRVGGGRAVDRDELAVVVEVVLLEVAVEQLDDLGRVHEPAAARGDDPLGAVVERLQRLGGRPAELDGDAAAGRVEHPQHAVLVADAQAQLDQLEPEPGAHAREAVDDRARLGGREVDRRPGVEEQPVPVQALALRALRLERAHGLERLAHDPLELGQRGDAPVLVAHRRQVAHLGERHQALVLRVLARLGAEQVDVLGRRHPLERELAQPPDVHPLGEHRVHAAQVGVLLAVAA